MDGGILNKLSTEMLGNIWNDIRSEVRAGGCRDDEEETKQGQRRDWRG
jgi:hypothetical protein